VINAVENHYKVFEVSLEFEAWLISEESAEHRNAYRPPSATAKSITPAMQVYLAGTTTVGDPYMALIPFYVSGNVKIQEKNLQPNVCYNVFGKCDLTVGNGGKLGAWVYSVSATRQHYTPS
jgi:hypothetical protein